jgi:hypothetical protein
MFLQHIYQQEQFGEDWFTFKQLYTQMVRKFPSGSTFIEIGSWKGKSAAYMAVEIANSQKNISFCCIDTWQGSTEHQNFHELKDLYNIFSTNMSSLSNYFTPVKKTSLEAANMFENASIDFVFVDGSHEYIDVKNDILTWLPKIKKGGILAGHDYVPDSWPGIVKAVNECLPYFTVDVEQKCFIHHNE